MNIKSLPVAEFDLGEAVHVLSMLGVVGVASLNGKLKEPPKRKMSTKSTMLNLEKTKM